MEKLLEILQKAVKMVEAGEVLTDLKFLTALSEEEGEKKLVI
jgi:hypothetical protein